MGVALKYEINMRSKQKLSKTLSKMSSKKFVANEVHENNSKINLTKNDSMKIVPKNGKSFLKIVPLTAIKTSH